MNRAWAGGVAVVVVGCAAPKIDPITAQQAQVRNMMAAQLGTIRQIPDPQARLTAQRQIALSAAYGKDGDTVERVLADLAGTAAHDPLAAQCATQLAQADQGRVARRVAKTIADPAQRAGALAAVDKKPDPPAAALTTPPP